MSKAPHANHQDNIVSASMVGDRKPMQRYCSRVLYSLHGANRLMVSIARAGCSLQAFQQFTHTSILINDFIWRILLVLIYVIMCFIVTSKPAIVTVLRRCSVTCGDVKIGQVGLELLWVLLSLMGGLFNAIISNVMSDFLRHRLFYVCKFIICRVLAR
jgi:hypothetical protein